MGELGVLCFPEVEVEGFESCERAVDAVGAPGDADTAPRDVSDDFRGAGGGEGFNGFWRGIQTVCFCVVV